MVRTILSCVMAILFFAGSGVRAETCGGIYRVQPGETLSGIAEKMYKDAGLWTAIQSSNPALIGTDPNRIQAGTALRLSCIDGRPVGLKRMGQDGAAASPLTLAQVGKSGRTGMGRAQPGQIALLTGTDYAPFSDPDLPNGGILTEVVQAAMSAAAPARGFAIHRVEGWGNHLDPLLSNALLDMGFPWVMPDCGADPDSVLCAEFRASDPMFEMLMLLFVNTANPLAFAQDSDVHGARLCRPAGYTVHQLDGPGRRWLSEERVTLERPRSVAECFLMLGAGDVDGVVMNEFTGRAALKRLGLKDAISVAPRPLGIEGLHVLVHKSHPEADALLEMINGGLREIKADGTYNAILDAHMTRVWAEF